MKSKYEIILYWSEADEAFVVGIFSLLDVMLSIPMESALKLLTVPDAVAAALLRRGGVLGDLLTLAGEHP